MRKPGSLPQKHAELQPDGTLGGSQARNGDERPRPGAEPASQTGQYVDGEPARYFCTVWRPVGVEERQVRKGNFTFVQSSEPKCFKKSCEQTCRKVQ